MWVFCDPWLIFCRYSVGIGTPVSTDHFTRTLFTFHRVRNAVVVQATNKETNFLCDKAPFRFARNECDCRFYHLWENKLMPTADISKKKKHVPMNTLNFGITCKNLKNKQCIAHNTAMMSRNKHIDFRFCWNWIQEGKKFSTAVFFFYITIRILRLSLNFHANFECEVCGVATEAGMEKRTTANSIMTNHIHMPHWTNIYLSFLSRFFYSIDVNYLKCE